MLDFIIYFGLIIFSLSIIYSTYSLIKKNKNLAKKTKAKLAILLIISLIIESLLFYGSFIEPRRIVITTSSFQLSERQQNGLKQNNIKLALISDLHLGPYKKERFVEKICQKLASQKPDLVLLGGDFIAAPGPKKTKKIKDYTSHLYALKCISQHYPTYAVMGNHEYNVGRPYNFDNYLDQTDTIKKIFSEIGVQILENESLLFNNQLWLLGVDEVWALKSNINKALANTNNNYPKILLAHNPDIFHDIQKKHQIDLVFSGHTHGGQIQLPFIGTIVTPPSDLGKSCYEGFCSLDNATLLISRGIGETAVRARLFAPPEIVILELQF